jgi:hypothetical protein
MVSTPALYLLKDRMISDFFFSSSFTAVSERIVDKRITALLFFGTCCVNATEPPKNRIYTEWQLRQVGETISVLLLDVKEGTPSYDAKIPSSNRISIRENNRVLPEPTVTIATYSPII